ncbi:MAG: hypothetical protein A4E44_00006 [Methanosaeta sp. PtaB.Bin018]|nr:MAG: hypothetical protein A4E44_00006 [Methanosaeta sp. PtaB.Bin018]
MSPGDAIGCDSAGIVIHIGGDYPRPDDGQEHGQPGQGYLGSSAPQANTQLHQSIPRILRSLW